MSWLGEPGLRSRASAVVRGLLQPRWKTFRRRAPCVVVGHRGAARLEPENTIASFRRALDLGADAIETDICITADGVFVLWHDADPDERVALARQLGTERLAYRPAVPPLGSPLRRRVRDLSAEELRAHYRYAPNPLARETFHGPASAEIESLEDLLDWAPTDSRLRHVFLDVKLAADQRDAGRALFDLLCAAWGTLGSRTVHLLSPQAEIVGTLVERAKDAPRETRPRISADFELPGAGRIGPGTGADEISLGCGGRLWAGFRDDVASALRARDRGLVDAVTVWTINEGDRLEALVRAGVDGILTDWPDRLRAAAVGVVR